MKRVFAVLIATSAVAACGDSQEQAAKDAGYLLRMNQIVCHLAANELDKVSAWLDQRLKEHPSLAAYAKQGSTEADDVYARHRKESDGDQKDRSECERVRDLALKWQ
jgi:hypothetical protein